MKKIYKTPNLICIKIVSRGIIAGSLDGLDVNPTEGAVGKSDAWVKEDRGSRGGGYNVWDDDWNK